MYYSGVLADFHAHESTTRSSFEHIQMLLGLTYFAAAGTFHAEWGHEPYCLHFGSHLLWALLTAQRCWIEVGGVILAMYRETVRTMSSLVRIGETYLNTLRSDIVRSRGVDVLLVGVLTSLYCFYGVTDVQDVMVWRRYCDQLVLQLLWC